MPRTELKGPPSGMVGNLLPRVEWQLRLRNYFDVKNKEELPQVQS